MTITETTRPATLAQPHYTAPDFLRTPEQLNSNESQIDYAKFEYRELEHDLEYQRGLAEEHDNLDQHIYAGYARQEIRAIEKELAWRDAEIAKHTITPLYSFKVAGETLELDRDPDGSYRVSCYPNQDHEYTVLSRGVNRYNVVRSAARRFKDQFATA